MAFWQPVADRQNQRLRYRSDASRAGGAAGPPRRGATARRRAGQRAAVRRAGHHSHRVDRARGETVDLVVSDDGSRPARRGPRAGRRAILARSRRRAGPASGWRSPVRSPRVTAGRSRWSGPPKVVCWSAIACRRRVDDMMSDRSTMSRRAFILATAVLAAGCMRSEPDGRMRLAAGERGGLYLAFAELLGEAASRPAIRTSPSKWFRRRAVSTTSPGCAPGTSIWDSRWPTSPSGIGPRAPPQPHLAVARVYENYLQVVVRDSAAVHQLADLAGAAGLDRPGWIGCCGDQRGAVRGGRPSRSGRHAEVPPAGGAGSARGRRRGRAGVVRRCSDTGHRRRWTPHCHCGCSTLASWRRRWPGSPATPTSSAECRPGVRATRPAFYRRAESAAVPPGHRRRRGRRRGGRTRHRRTATGAPLRPRTAVPRPAVDDPDRPDATASRAPFVPTASCTAERESTLRQTYSPGVRARFSVNL